MFNILVAEDDKELNRLFCTVLEKNGYRCFPVKDGAAAVEALDKEYIDLIETEQRTVDVHIGRLRERFRENKDFEIITIRGLGYKAVKTA